ncbi:MAG: hypothetical protein AAGE94_25280, partial [Acidobacteriota bacterium]
MVLATCLVYAYIGLQLPKKSFDWDLRTWEVTTPDRRCTASDPTRCLQAGDTILTIDGVRRETWLQDRSAAIFTGDRRASLSVERDGRVLEVALDWTQEPLARTIEVLVSSTFPLLFWLDQRAPLPEAAPHLACVNATLASLAAQPFLARRAGYDHLILYGYEYPHW